jgi:hypothetical protein
VEGGGNGCKGSAMWTVIPMHLDKIVKKYIGQELGHTDYLGGDEDISSLI